MPYRLFIVLFGMCCNFCFGLNLDFQINRNISLFSQIFFDKTISEELEKEITSSFSSLTSNEDEQAEFISCLADINRKYNHKYMTPNFLNLWHKVSEKYDSQFQSDMEILAARALEMKEYNEKIASHIDFDAIFDFYDSQLKVKDSLKVFVCSTIKNSGSFAKSFGNNIILKFNWGNKAADICEILKQVCHRLFQTMDPNTKLSMRNYFLSHKSSNALPAYFMLDDVLAYAIGGLWIHSKLPDPKDSVLQHPNDNKIEKIAKSTLNMVDEYLKAEKKIDKAFFEKFIKHVEEQFPKAYEEYAIMMKRICLVVENGIDVPECKQIIKSAFQIDEIQNEIGPYTTLFIGTNLGAPALRTIQSKLPHRNEDYLFITKDEKTRKLYIIIKTNDMDKINKAVERIKKQQAIRINYEEGL